MDDQPGSAHWVVTGPPGAFPVKASNEEAWSAETPTHIQIAESNLEMPAGYFFSKRIIDVVGALILAAVFSPILLVVIVSLRRDGGDILFRHTRIGRNGKTFKVYKFRTMVPNAAEVLRDLIAANSELREEWLRDHKLRNDPRVTTMGGFLRRASLDELPQLWNVLKGEMSLVGPRPIIREELCKYGRAARYYLAVKPGLTGIWQVSGRNDTDYRRRVAMDRHYACTASLKTDLVVLVKTVDVVLRRRGAY